MGSYISIHNNTRDTYLVKVGYDQAALEIASIVGAVVGAVASIIATAGSAAPLTAALVANGVVEVFGVTTASLAAMTALASSISAITIPATVGGWALSMSKFLTAKLEDDDYVQIEPGQTKRFGKYSLSLWRQATCHRVRPDPENSEQVVMDTLFMRPIFSGATDESTLTHDIQYWINQFGHENRYVVRMSQNDINLAKEAHYGEAMEKIDWIKVAEEAALKAKNEELATCEKRY